MKTLGDGPPPFENTSQEPADVATYADAVASWQSESVRVRDSHFCRQDSGRVSRDAKPSTNHPDRTGNGGGSSDSVSSSSG